MPELPEAETIARGLQTYIAGRRVRRVRIHRKEVVEPMTMAAFRRGIQDRRIESVGRRAKWIVGQLEGGGRWVTQLRMTGRFRWAPQASRLVNEPHLSASLLLAGATDSGVLRFYDTRRFGRMWILDAEAWAELDSRLGIEPLSKAFSVSALAERLDSSHAPIRNILLDQGRIAGIGNIYANEACYLAGIDPRRAAGDLRDAEVARLWRAIRSVLGDAVTGRGTSLSDYRDLVGDEGGFQARLDVYGRAGEPCRRCGTEISRAVLAGRSAFFCPSCQS